MNMRSSILIIALGAIGSGCAQLDAHMQAAGSDSIPPPDDPVVVQLAGCDGLCIATAPATYTGPSLFWLGVPTYVPPCPPETPYEGIEGIVEGTKVTVLAKECRITPSDLCDDEGLTCAPIPEQDLHLCIHHLGDASCPVDYPERTTISEVETHMPVTLCCQKPPVAG